MQFCTEGEEGEEKRGEKRVHKSEHALQMISVIIPLLVQFVVLQCQHLPGTSAVKINNSFEPKTGMHNIPMMHGSAIDTAAPRRV